MFRRVSFLKAALWSAAALLLATVITSSQTSAQVSSSQCCTPAQSTIETSGTTGWIVQPSSGTAVPAVAIAPFMSWHAALGSSQWIANVGNAGHHNQPVNDYTYVYRFCLCALPEGLRQSPTTMHLWILSDNEFKAYVNSTGPFLQGGAYSFQLPTQGSPPANAFISGWNTLKIVVHNDGGETGLDVAGWVAGYFTTCRTKPTPIPIHPYNPQGPQRQHKAGSPSPPPP
jgi:hypothetical protein